MKRGFLTFVMAILLTSLVLGAKVGVSPASVNFKNVLRGGYSERPIIVTIDSEKEVKVNIETRGQIKDWLDIKNQNFSVSKSRPYVLNVSVRPPADIPNGNYSGFIRIQSDPLGESNPGMATGVIVPAIDVYVVVEVIDKEIIGCKATNFEVESPEEGKDIIFSLDIENTGNVRIIPEIKIDIWDQTSSYIVKKENKYGKEILPTRKERVLVRVPSNDLKIGQYFADIMTLQCLNKATLTFDVLEKGALKSDVRIEKIIVNPWASVGETVLIKIIFKNFGEKSVESKFDGKITLDDKIVHLLKSEDPILIRPNETQEESFYFTPKNPGKYVIKGRIFYDGKRTFENTAILNVTKKEGFNLIRISLYLLLALIILYLIKKIIDEKREIRNKLKRLKK